MLYEECIDVYLEAAFEIALHLWICGQCIVDPFYVSYIEIYVTHYYMNKKRDIESILSKVECWYDP